MNPRMFTDNLAADGTHLASGIFPVALFSDLSAGVKISLINIFVVAVIRLLEMRARQRDRRELERYRIDRELELKAQRQKES